MRVHSGKIKYKGKRTIYNSKTISACGIRIKRISDRRKDITCLNCLRTMLDKEM